MVNRREFLQQTLAAGAAAATAGFSTAQIKDAKDPAAFVYSHDSNVDDAAKLNTGAELFALPLKVQIDGAVDRKGKTIVAILELKKDVTNDELKAQVKEALEKNFDGVALSGQFYDMGADKGAELIAVARDAVDAGGKGKKVMTVNNTAAALKAATKLDYATVVNAVSDSAGKPVELKAALKWQDFTQNLEAAKKANPNLKTAMVDSVTEPNPTAKEDIDAVKRISEVHTNAQADFSALTGPNLSGINKAPVQIVGGRGK